ncbi:MAG: helix-turn-helix transcriptional regulator [Gammaproteobacteria bacterium]|nr:helix-turn-helix transcriptional regulator [Gammaproteobacteria bacterium]
MAYSKSDKFSEGEQETAAIAKALAHPARVAILKVLAKYQSCLCGEVVAELPLSQSTVSQHLKELRTAGLIKGKQDGPSVTYSIDKGALDKAGKKMKKFFSKIDSWLVD